MKTVVGLFDTYAHAEIAAHDLERIGISHEDISLLANNTTAQGDPTDDASIQSLDTETEAEKGAVAGGVAGLLIGLAALAIPGLGAVAAAGWLVTTVAGAAVGAGVGVVGALNGVGVPHEDAVTYNEGVRRGGTLLAVRAQDDQAAQVARILSADGAVNIEERAEQYRQEEVVPPAPPVPEPALNSVVIAPEPTVDVNDIDRDVETTLPVADEGVRNVEQEAEHGGVRVDYHTTERPIAEGVIVEEIAIVDEEFIIVDEYVIVKEELVEVEEPAEVDELVKVEKPVEVGELVEVEVQPSALTTDKPGVAAITHDLKPEIARRAYELYEQRGHRDGYALDDWLDAERELQSHEV
jgi:hypothetical protein